MLSRVAERPATRSASTAGGMFSGRPLGSAPTSSFCSGRAAGSAPRATAARLADRFDPRREETDNHTFAAISAT